MQATKYWFIETFEFLAQIPLFLLGMLGFSFALAFVLNMLQFVPQALVMAWNQVF